MALHDTTQTKGKWPSILAAIGVDRKFISGKNTECPFCGGKDRFRFTNRDGAGVWICNVCGTGNGYHFVQNWSNVDFKGAVKEIERVLPMAKAAAIPVPKDARRRLNDIWSKAEPIEFGDPVFEYLMRRNVMPASGNLSFDLRCHPGLTYFEDGVGKSVHPAMVALVRDWTGKPTTLHVTYLNDDGGKADVPKQKKILSAMGEGAHVELNNPDSEHSLCLTEGIETGLAVLIRTGRPVWAMLSAGGLVAFRKPKDVDTVEIWGDNDASYAGQAHAFALAYRLTQKREAAASVLIPDRVGTDWADRT